jgi:hypothetical protein
VLTSAVDKENSAGLSLIQEYANPDTFVLEAKAHTLALSEVRPVL